MKEEFKVFIRKPVFVVTFLLLAVVMVFSYFQLPDTSTYDSLYEKYHDQLELYETDNSTGLIEISDASAYLYDQVQYLNEINETIQHNIDVIEAQMGSKLFQDDLETLGRQQTYEQSRKESNIVFENTYYDESLVTNRYVVYMLYAVGLIWIISMFFDDIQNHNIQLYRTTSTHLTGMFIHKLLVYICIMFISSLIPLMIELLLCKGNYSVYCFSSLSSAFMDLSIKQYIIYKYLSCFICILLVSFLYLMILLITRNHVISIVILAITGFIEYIAYGFITETNAMMPFKYINLMYWLFFDQGRYLSIGSVSIIVKILLLIVLVTFLFIVYTKGIHIAQLTSKRFSLRSVDPFAHVIYEVMIEAKGILAVIVILLYAGYNIYNFRITKDSKEEYYQSFKTSYLGEITEEKYLKICEDYEKIDLAYEKAQSIYQQANKDPENASQIYGSNLDILELARNNENIARVRSEYEEAMEQGVQTFVDNRGAQILFMKGQTVFFIQSMLVIVIPLVTVCLYHDRLMHQKERYLLINTSSLGIKVTKKISSICYFLLILISTCLYTGLHIYKVTNKYPVYFTNTLKDLLIMDVSVPVWLALIICELILTMFIFGITRFVSFMKRKISVIRV